LAYAAGYCSQRRLLLAIESFRMSNRERRQTDVGTHVGPKGPPNMEHKAVRKKSILLAVL